MHCPACLTDVGLLQERVRELSEPLFTHFADLRKLRSYARGDAQEWFPNAKLSVASVTRPIIRASETTAIAMLTGNEPAFRISKNGATVGSYDTVAGQENAKYERIARAVHYRLDDQFDTSLLHEVVSRAVRQGELIVQYGWLSEEERLVGAGETPADAFSPFTASPATELTGPNASQVDLPAPGDQIDAPSMLDTPSDLGMSPDMSGDMLSGEAYATELHDERRFPLFVRFLDRLKVYYELDPLTRLPVEVYHSYWTTVSQALLEFPMWDGGNRVKNERVQIVDAYARGYRAVMIDQQIVLGPLKHGYGARPPFIIERCRPENVAEFVDAEDQPEVLAGIPFCYDMMSAFEEACIASSLKKTILEYSAMGAKTLENTDERRFRQAPPGEQRPEITLGPGTIFTLYKGEVLKDQQPPTLPPVLQSYLEEAEKDAATLSFSPALLRGEMPGDPSGYSIEQVRQMTSARLQPYKVTVSRALSRLFRALFFVLKDNWAAEWGNVLTLQGQKGGELFVEEITPQDLETPPEHIEVEVMPLTPQNKIAERQSNLAMWQAGAMDIFDVMEDDGVADPQETFNSILIHRLQLEDPNFRQVAAAGVLRGRLQRAQRAGATLPIPDQVMIQDQYQLQPTGRRMPVPPPGAKVIGGPHGNMPMPNGPRAAQMAPAQAPNPAGVAPLGALGTPNSPYMPVARNGQMEQRRSRGGRPPRGSR